MKLFEDTILEVVEVEHLQKLEVAATHATFFIIAVRLTATLRKKVRLNLLKLIV